MELKTRSLKPDNQQLIVRQCCLKVAVETVAILSNKALDVKTLSLSEQVTMIAEKFEEWVWR